MIPMDEEMPEDEMGEMEMGEESFDDAAALEELERAADAGEQFAGESFFAPVPGAGEGKVELEAEGKLSPEMLQQLLEQLSMQQG